MKQIYKLLTALILFTAISPTIKAQVNTQDSLALVDLYTNCGGSNWIFHTNWLTTAPVSSWIGITESGNRVTSLVLSNNQLTGTIPTSIGNLRNLTVLELDANQLGGSIPETIGSLTNLTYLTLATNQLTGIIPSSIGNFTNLTTLDVESNQLSGIIPAALGSLTNINYLNLNNNQLSGSIPPALGNLQNVYVLTLNDNKLSGSIPTTFGNLISIYILNLSNNLLSGSIPTTFSKLSNLYELAISSNKITGNLPSFIGNLNNLVYLYVDNNGLSGPIPSSLSNLNRLKALTLQNNQFTFDGMEGIDSLPIANKTYAPQAPILMYNNTDNFSVSAGGTLANDTFRWYKDTGLVATIVGDSTFIPSIDGKYWATITNSKVKNLTLYADTLYVQWAPVKQDSLALVDLYKSTNGPKWKNHTNWLTKAPISSWYGITKNAGRITDIALFNNNLSGKLLPSIGDLTGLKQISLHINAIGGNIPASFGNLTKLISLDLGENKFTGTIPDSLASLTKLTQLDLDGNQLTGSIPSWIGNFTGLQDLWLQYNSFTDSIPTSIGNLTGLQYLVLQNNNLSGPIPATFGNLNNLQGLFLQNNNFTFDGMELIATKFPFAHYAPQAPIPLYKSVNNNGDTILMVHTGCMPTNGLYQWYNGNKLVATIYTDSTYKVPMTGKYSVQSTDALLPYFVLYSDTIDISTSLPIKSIKLQATPTNGKVILQWQTVDEIKTASFIIQHSTDGVTFTDIDSIDAVGYGNNNYSIKDKSPAIGTNYYRIKAIDNDGSYCNSKVVSVKFDVNRLAFTVAPNPARDNVKVMGNHIATLKVIDNLGRVVANKSFKDATNPSLTIGSLPTGVYHLSVIVTEGKEYQVEFIKE